MERSRRDRNIQIVNFGLAPLTKSVECSAVCADHCQPANLISPDFWRRRPGFRVEHFIRPPLHLTFHFLVPINIACVLIKPDLIESARTNITVWASSSIHPEPHQQQMVLCGRGTVSGEGAVLAFWNKSFERRHQEVDLSSVSNVAGSHMSNWDLEKFSKEPMKEIYNVRRLKLSINYFSGPKPVALKQVEVWGTLGGCCSGEKKRAAQAAIAELRTSANMGLYTNCSSRLCQGVMSRPWTSAAPETFSTGDRGAVESAHNVPKHDIKHRPGEEHKSINSCTIVKRTLLHSRTGKAMDGEAPEPPVILEGPQASSTHPSAQFGGHLSLQCSPHPQCCSLQPKGTCCCSDEEHSKSPADLCRCSWPLEGCGAGIDVMTAVGRSRSEPPYASTVSASGSGSTDVLGQNSREEDHSIWDTSPIPEQFLDEITFELMLLPMLLPSGHFVDQSTLERLAHTDSTYGRPPSDPFTGMTSVLPS